MHLILLDVNMPQVDGKAFCQALVDGPIRPKVFFYSGIDLTQLGQWPSSGAARHLGKAEACQDAYCNAGEPTNRRRDHRLETRPLDRATPRRPGV